MTSNAQFLSEQFSTKRRIHIANKDKISVLEKMMETMDTLCRKVPESVLIEQTKIRLEQLANLRIKGLQLLDEMDELIKKVQGESELIDDDSTTDRHITTGPDDHNSDKENEFNELDELEF